MPRTLSVSSVVVFCLATLGLGVAAEPPMQGPAPDAGRLDVGGAFGEAGGRLISQKDRGDGTKILHGMQVVLGPRNWLKEYAVFNEGALEQRTQFYPNGRTFRVQRREHNGDGHEVIYTPERNKEIAEDVRVDGGAQIGPLKTQGVICQGTVKADKRWEGSFLVREPIPGEFGRRLRLQEYRKGDLAKSGPFPVEQLGLDKSHTDPKRWLWDFPEWPAAPSPSSRK